MLLARAPPRPQLEGTLFGAEEQEEAQGEEYEIGKPRSEPGRDPPLARQRDPDERDHVIRKDQQDGEHEAARFAALLRRETEWYSHQSQHEASSREREAAMKFNQVPARGHRARVARLLQQTPCADHADWQRFLRPVLGGRQFDRNVSLLEGGYLVVVGVARISLVLRTVYQMKMEAVGRFADDDTFFRQSDLWVSGVGEVGHEYIFPDGRSLRVFHVLNIQNVFGETFVEDAGLNLKRHLGALELVFKPGESGLRAGSDVDTIREGKQPPAATRTRRANAGSSKCPCRKRASL